MSSTAVQCDPRPVASRSASQDLYRLLILRKNGSELLVASHRPPFTLPCVEIPRWERVAEQLNEAVRNRYGISAICLFVPESWDTTTTKRPLYQVMEMRASANTVPDEMDWLALESISVRSFADEQDLLTVKAVLRKIDGFQIQATIEPFGRPGWIGELVSWVQSEIDLHELRLTGPVRQLNASPTYALLRLETNESAVWFKAVGEPNLREFPISVALSRLFPGFVPTVVATRPSWHGWLAMEFGGSTLDEVPDARAWDQAARTLARLQIASLRTTDQFLADGCHDLRTDSLLASVDPFVDVMSQLMEEQKNSPPVILRKSELLTLGEQLTEALSDLANLNIPDTLGHLDFNPGNIICSADQCVFVDWAETCVGSPFLTLQYLREHLERLQRKDTSLNANLVEAYETEWHKLLSPEIVSAAMSLAPVLAVFAYAVGATAWRNATILNEPTTAAYLRSLTRRMHLEAIRLRERRHTCSS